MLVIDRIGTITFKTVHWNTFMIIFKWNFSNYGQTMVAVMKLLDPRFPTWYLPLADHFQPFSIALWMMICLPRAIFPHLEQSIREPTGGRYREITHREPWISWVQTVAADGSLCLFAFGSVSHHGVYEISFTEKKNVHRFGTILCLIWTSKYFNEGNKCACDSYSEQW